MAFNTVDDNWFATASRDQSIRIYDLRMLGKNDYSYFYDKEDHCLHSFQAHNSEIWSLKWHPIHKELLVSAAYDGSLRYWSIGGLSQPQLQATIPAAHEGKKKIINILIFLKIIYKYYLK